MSHEEIPFGGEPREGQPDPLGPEDMAFLELLTEVEALTLEAEIASLNPAPAEGPMLNLPPGPSVADEAEIWLTLERLRAERGQQSPPPEEAQ